MSSLLFDANALVYWVYPSSSFNAEVSQLLRCAFEQRAAVYALSSSLNEIYYALHTHYMSEADARASVRDIAETFDLVDLTGTIVHEALGSNEPDYEDGLIRAAAESLQVDAIVTYDKRAFKKSEIPALTAAQAQAVLFQAG